MSITIRSFTGACEVEEYGRDDTMALDRAIREAETHANAFLARIDQAPHTVQWSTQTLYLRGKERYIHIISLCGDLPPEVP